MGNINPMAAPNQNYPTNHVRTNSFGSQGSHHSYLTRHATLPVGMGMHTMGNYHGFVGETEALLAQQHLGAGNGGGLPGAVSGRPGPAAIGPGHLRL